MSRVGFGGGSGGSGRGSKARLPTLVNQPKFASQLQSQRPVLGEDISLQRGYMLWAQPMKSIYGGGGPLNDGRDMINFLFNPSTVSTDYNVGNTSLQAAMMYQVPGDQGNLLAPMLYQTVSWQLYFDRTFELNYGRNSSAVNDPVVIGCQADVFQFMQFTGVNAQLSKQQAQSIQGAGGSQVGSKSSGTAGAVTTGGMMMMVPCYVYFGNALQQMNQNVNSSNFNAVGSQLAFYGFISEWSVTYTHWTSNMVPIRCSVSVSFTMLPNPPKSIQAAVWKDLQRLGKQPSTAPLPYTGGGQPPIPFPGSHQ